MPGIPWFTPSRTAAVTGALAVIGFVMAALFHPFPVTTFGLAVAMTFIAVRNAILWNQARRAPSGGQPPTSDN